MKALCNEAPYSHELNSMSFLPEESLLLGQNCLHLIRFCTVCHASSRLNPFHAELIKMPGSLLLVSQSDYLI